MKKDQSIESPKRGLKGIIRYIKRVYWRPEMNLLPGQLAFFIILSLVPLVTLVGYGASFLGLSIESITNILNNLSPGISGMIEANGDSVGTSFLVFFGIMLYIASNGLASIIVTSNTIYNIPQKPWLHRRIKGIFLTIFLVSLYLFVLLIPALVYQLIAFVDAFNIRPILVNTITMLQVPITWLIIFIFIKIIYTIAPDKRISSKYMNLGAIFTTTGWVITSTFYGFWVRNFARHDLFYAGLANIAVLMLWIYFLSQIFVVGMSINYRTFEKSGNNWNK